MIEKARTLSNASSKPQRASIMNRRRPAGDIWVPTNLNEYGNVPILKGGRPIEGGPNIVIMAKMVWIKIRNGRSDWDGSVQERRTNHY